MWAHDAGDLCIACSYSQIQICSCSQMQIPQPLFCSQPKLHGAISGHIRCPPTQISCPLLESNHTPGFSATPQNAGFTRLFGVRPSSLSPLHSYNLPIPGRAPCASPPNTMQKLSCKTATQKLQCKTVMQTSSSLEALRASTTLTLHLLDPDSGQVNLEPEACMSLSLSLAWLHCFQGQGLSRASAGHAVSG